MCGLDGPVVRMLAWNCENKIWFPALPQLVYVTWLSHLVLQWPICERRIIVVPMSHGLVLSYCDNRGHRSNSGRKLTLFFLFSSWKLFFSLLSSFSKVSETFLLKPSKSIHSWAETKPGKFPTGGLTFQKVTSNFQNRVLEWELLDNLQHCS